MRQTQVSQHSLPLAYQAKSHNPLWQLSSKNTFQCNVTTSISLGLALLFTSQDFSWVLFHGDSPSKSHFSRQPLSLFGSGYSTWNHLIKLTVSLFIFLSSGRRVCAATPMWPLCSAKTPSTPLRACISGEVDKPMAFSSAHALAHLLLLLLVPRILHPSEKSLRWR